MQFVKYINLLGDTPKSSSALTIGKEYQVQALASLVDPGDAYRIINDNHQTQHYFKTRFSKPIER